MLFTNTAEMFAKTIPSQDLIVIPPGVLFNLVRNGPEAKLVYVETKEADQFLVNRASLSRTEI